VTPDKILEDPACRWVLERFACVMRHRRVMLLEGCAEALLQSRLDEHTHRHDHPERHHPRGCCAIERRGQNAGGVAEANAAFRLRLALIAVSQGLGRSRRVVECMGGEQETPRLVDAWVTERPGGGQGPCKRGDHLIRLGTWARAPPCALAWRGASGHLVQIRGLPTWWKGRKRLRRSRFTGTGHAA
jgi:hypothetical protein